LVIPSRGQAAPGCIAPTLGGEIVPRKRIGGFRVATGATAMGPAIGARYED